MRSKKKLSESKSYDVELCKPYNDLRCRVDCKFLCSEIVYRLDIETNLKTNNILHILARPTKG